MPVALSSLRDHNVVVMSRFPFYDGRMANAPTTASAEIGWSMSVEALNQVQVFASALPRQPSTSELDDEPDVGYGLGDR